MKRAGAICQFYGGLSAMWPRMQERRVYGITGNMAASYGLKMEI
jgi:hypothetical protein